MTATQALTGGILKILSLSEILPVYLLDRLYACMLVSHSVSQTVDGYKSTNTAYLVGFRRQYKTSCYMWKMCCGEPQNLAN